MDTSCKDCIFAQYDGNTQTDCKLNLISQYRQFKQVDDCYDNEKEFYVIRNTLCMRNRNSTWKYTNLTLDEQITQLKAEIRPKLDLLINLNEFKTLDDIDTTFANISNCVDKLVVFNSNFNNDSILEIIKKYQNNIKLWEVIHVLDNRLFNSSIEKYILTNKDNGYYTILTEPITQQFDANFFFEFAISNLSAFSIVKKNNIVIIDKSVYRFWYFNVLDKDFQTWISETQTCNENFCRIL